MGNVNTMGVDLAKRIFQIHGVDAKGRVVLQKRVSRIKFAQVMASLPTCLVGIEASGGSNYWARRLQEMGHEVKQMSPQHVKPYIGSTKNDYKDAAGICEAVSRPKMLFVPIKTTEQQDIQSVHRIRTRLVESRTKLSNQIRGLLGEYGVILPKGIRRVKAELGAHIEEAGNELTPVIRELLVDLHEELLALDKRVERYDARIKALFKANKRCRKIGELAGVGPLTATALIASIGDATVFKNGRQLSAWLGLTPRQYSSGERQCLGRITKRGDRYLRYLLVHGARSVVKYCGNKADAKSLWLQDKVVRRGKNKAAVALANKTVRTVWAMLTEPTLAERAA